jgi:hypothetical protein
MDMRAGFLGSPLFRELQDHASDDDYPESEAKRHHLVPRFLLRRFVSPGASPEKLCQLDLESGKPAKVTPTSAAAQTRFYRLTDGDGTEHQRLESFSRASSLTPPPRFVSYVKPRRRSALPSARRCSGRGMS